MFTKTLGFKVKFNVLPDLFLSIEVDWFDNEYFDLKIKKFKSENIFIPNFHPAE